MNGWMGCARPGQQTAASEWKIQDCVEESIKKTQQTLQINTRNHRKTLFHSVTSISQRRSRNNGSTQGRYPKSSEMQTTSDDSSTGYRPTLILVQQIRKASRWLANEVLRETLNSESI